MAVPDGIEKAEGQQMNDRTCIVSRSRVDPGEMIRFVLDPDGNVVADLNHKLPGRGVWVTGRRDMVALAVRKQLFARGFKQAASAPDDLADRVEQQLLSAAQGALAMARKAGLIVTGFEKVEAAIRARKVALVLHATEAAPDGMRKLAAAAKSVCGQETGPGGGPAVKQIFPFAQMDLALGGHNVIHAAAKHGGATGALLRRIETLERYRS